MVANSRSGRLRWAIQCATATVAVLAIWGGPLRGEETAKSETIAESSAAASARSSDAERARETALANMLSGATLEGSFTDTAQDKRGAKLDREKYTLGEVKKVAGDVWQFPARIEYGGKDVTLPILLPVKWAGDTPVVVVDTVDLPGFGSVSARVLFFEGHYAGYWKHGEHRGNLFGLIHSVNKAEGNSGRPPSEKEKAGEQDQRRVRPLSGGQPPAPEQPQQ